MMFVISVGNKIMRLRSLGGLRVKGSVLERDTKQTSFLRQECGRGFNVVRACFNQADA